MAAASMWSHVLRLCEMRAVGAHGGLALAVGGGVLLFFWFLSMAPVFGGALPLGERYAPAADGTCSVCELTSMLASLYAQPFVSVALAALGAMGGPLLQSVGGASNAIKQRAEARRKRQREAEKYVVNEEDEKSAFALQLADFDAQDKLQAGESADAAPPEAPHVNAGAPIQMVVHSKEAFGVLLTIFFIVIAPGIISRVVKHNTLPQLSPVEGEFISIISWNINYGWSSDGRMNVQDVADRVERQEA